MHCNYNLKTYCCHVTAEGVCQSNEIACVLGGCVNATQLCDGVVDCEDGSDEFKCSKYSKKNLLLPYNRKFSRDPIFAVFAVDWQTTKIKSAK